jgi:AhpD family alkylhydroperoxidase
LSRIDGVPDSSDDARVQRAYEGCRGMLGVVTQPLRVTAHHPGILEGYGALEWAFSQADEVDEHLKHLAAVKAAALIGCEFCLDIGSEQANRSGVTAEQLLDLSRYQESEHFDEIEKLVLTYAVAMTRTPVEVPDELFKELRSHFDERQLVELTTAIALENYRGRFNWAFGIEAQGFRDEASICAFAEPEPGQIARSRRSPTRRA